MRLALLKYRVGGLWPVVGKGAREHLARVAGEAPALEPPRPADQRPTATPAAAQPDRFHPLMALALFPCRPCPCCARRLHFGGGSSQTSVLSMVLRGCLRSSSLVHSAVA